MLPGRTSTLVFGLWQRTPWVSGSRSSRVGISFDWKRTLLTETLYIQPSSVPVYSPCVHSIPLSGAGTIAVSMSTVPAAIEGQVNYPLLQARHPLLKVPKPGPSGSEAGKASLILIASLQAHRVHLLSLLRGEGMLNSSGWVVRR